MSKFKQALVKKIRRSLSNRYGVDNYNELRFGKYDGVLLPADQSPNAFILFAKRLVKGAVGYSKSAANYNLIDGWLSEEHQMGLQRLYDNLDGKGKKLLIELLAYRRLGFKFVKLQTNNKAYWDAVKLGESLADKSDTIDPHFMHFILEKMDLNPIGIDVKLYFSGMGVAIDFILEQYAYKSKGNTIVGAEKGDIVIDAGACWGDTALYFAYKIGKEGKVYSFEFIPDNIKLFDTNLAMNPDLKDRIHLVKHPVSNKSGEEIYFKDNGPGSKVKSEPFSDQTGSVNTISIDDYVKNAKIEKVNFIKMDIEGAELSALQGARETIKKFRPKLAIAMYHGMDDFVNIPNWIIDLNLDYEIFIDHYTIHEEETVCFANPKSRK